MSSATALPSPLRPQHHASAPSPDALRLDARRLLRNARRVDPDALTRMRRLDTLASVASDAALSERVRLKHALAVVALEHGFDSWSACVHSARQPAAPDADLPRDLMYVRGHDVLLNRWFARYDEAAASRADAGGYLLPYRHQFFVCEAEGIRLLGLDPDDPDWARIGWDWVQPRDPVAWQRLHAARLRAIARG
ncbi:MAG: hypothetical protein AAF772_01790 [Acidobacteriota bacterium]